MSWTPNPRFPYFAPDREALIYRHGFWQDHRQKVYDALVANHVNDNRLRRFHGCGDGVWLYVSEDNQQLSLRCSCCHDRFCEACGRSRARQIRANVEKHITGINSRFLTITLRHNHTSYRAQLDRLYRCFSTLRRRKDWKEHVAGGAAFLECKLGRDGLLHPHFHVLLEGTWWQVTEIAKAWHEVTGDSYVVDIRQEGSDEQRAKYAAKYCTKPASDDFFLHPLKLRELLDALKGRRLAFTFGTWRGVLLLCEPEHDDVSWIPLGSLSKLAANAAAGDDTARRFLEAAVRKWPNLGEYHPHPTEADFDLAPP